MGNRIGLPTEDLWSSMDRGPHSLAWIPRGKKKQCNALGRGPSRTASARRDFSTWVSDLILAVKEHIEATANGSSSTPPGRGSLRWRRNGRAELGIGEQRC